jgi:hypothetical protein
LAAHWRGATLFSFTLKRDPIQPARVAKLDRIKAAPINFGTAGTGGGVTGEWRLAEALRNGGSGVIYQVSDGRETQVTYLRVGKPASLGRSGPDLYDSEKPEGGS